MGRGDGQTLLLYPWWGTYAMLQYPVYDQRNASGSAATAPRGHVFIPHSLRPSQIFASYRAPKPRRVQPPCPCNLPPRLIPRRRARAVRRLPAVSTTTALLSSSIPAARGTAVSTTAAWTAITLPRVSLARTALRRRGRREVALAAIAAATLLRLLLLVLGRALRLLARVSAGARAVVLLLAWAAVALLALG